MNITVFCGASIGNNELYKKKTIELAEWIANNNHTLVYELEFYYNNIEYDYEINATTGDIISYDKDSIYD